MGLRRTTRARLLTGCIAIGLTGCAASPEVKVPSLPSAQQFDFSRAPDLGRPQWTRNLPGLITEVVMASNGDVVLSTRPERGQGHHAIFRIASNGQIRWRASFKNLIRSVTLSSDETTVFYNAYQDELGAIGPQGKVSWRRKGLCRPHAVENGGLLCFQDDDDRPGLVFEVIDSTGRSLWKKEAPFDAITLGHSESLSHVAVGYVGGGVELIEIGANRTIWEKKVPGEIVDIATSADGSRTAVLFTHLKKEKKLISFDVKGTQLGEVTLAFPAEQILFSGKSHRLLAADPSGAAPRFAAINLQANPEILWERESPQPAEYSVGARPLHPGWAVYLGVVASAGRLIREAEVTGLSADTTGSIQWKAHVQVPAGGYLYTFDGIGPADRKPGWLAIATDLGAISVFKISPNPEQSPSR